MSDTKRSERFRAALCRERAFWRDLRRHVFGWSSGEQEALLLLTAVLVLARTVMLLAKAG